MTTLSMPGNAGQETRDRVASTLRGFDATVEQLAPARWIFRPSTGAAGIECTVADGWLRMESPASAAWPPPGEVWSSFARLLVLNALPGNVARWCLRKRSTREAASLCIRADRRLSEDVDIAPLIERLVASLQTALAGASGDGAAAMQPTDVTDAAQPGASAGPDELAEACAAAGWTSRVQSDRLSVTLESRSSPARASISRIRGDVMAWTELERFADLSPASRQALSLLLLCLGGVARLVRPVLHDEGAEVVVAMNVSLGGAPTPADIDAALGALSVAACICGRAISSLAHQTIALEYLRVLGWSM